MYTTRFHCDLSEILGLGSYGNVYKGQDRKTEQNIAVKRIEHGGNYDDEEGFYDRYMKKEIDVMNSLSPHENITQFLGFHKHLDYLYFIMEYCNGLDMETYLKEHNTDLNFQLHALNDCASALNFLHTKHHVIHRDVKLTNILVHERDDGRIVAKLSDFGLAKVFDPNEEFEFLNSGLGGGCMAFKAPELYDSAGTPCNAAVDVFAMGLVYLCIIGCYNVLDIVCPGWGYGMAVFYRKALPLFTEEQLAETSWPLNKLKTLITRMTQAKAQDRPTMAVVENELTTLKIEYEKQRTSSEPLEEEQESTEGGWTFLQIPDESPEEAKNQAWKKIPFADVQLGDHICWWCNKDDKSIIKAPYWRHGIVAQKNDTTLTIIGWKFHCSDTGSYRPEVVKAEMELADDPSIHVACYEDSYSPEVVIDRAQFHVGDRDYNIVSNFARALPRWCKTGYGGFTFVPPEKRKLEWDVVKVTEVKVGDHVCWWTWPRGMYWRHAIVTRVWADGSLGVIGWRFNPQREIVETDVKFKEEKSVHRARHSKSARYGPEEVLQRARKRLGETDYNVLTNYARAFPRWCITGYGGIFTRLSSTDSS